MVTCKPLLQGALLLDALAARQRWHRVHVHGGRAAAIHRGGGFPPIPDTVIAGRDLIADPARGQIADRGCLVGVWWLASPQVIHFGVLAE
ncbi:MAG TPA: hypothetical protein VME44_07925 [Streptosporangiaceae bacterium]|nr:hypothetical protein [Streptosporangiaceae bacterium]